MQLAAPWVSTKKLGKFAGNLPFFGQYQRLERSKKRRDIMETSSETPHRDAVAEGRRIYLGNLPYSVQPGDVEDLLRQHGFTESFDKLHISIDPVSGRNPGYCFAEFTAREEANRALETLPGASLFNRAVKVGPCHPKTTSQSRWGGSRGGDYTPTFNRWGDWKGSEQDGQQTQHQDQQGPYAARQHLDTRTHRSPDKTQLYIGGLGMMINQEHHDREMQEILAGFDYVAIGKRITPHISTRSAPGNHHYCFVDFSSAGEAERALNALHGKEVEGGTLRVSFPRTKGPAFEQGGTNHGWRNQGNNTREPRQPVTESQQDGQDRKEQNDRQRAIMASNNWRSGASTK
ncbi:hypothetical protein VTI74DRAFT_1524 [Chaetomium olivicolor]